MRKRIFSIWSVLVVLVVSVAVLVPSCTPTTGTIEVKATLDGAPWYGAVDYTLTGPGATAPTIINGTSVSTNHTVEAGNWTCAYVSGGPGTFVNITSSATQEVSAGGTTTFTLNFVTPKPVDASVEFDSWTINGLRVDPGWYPVYPGDWVDIEYKEHVSGEGDAVVTVHQTSWLQVHNIGPWGEQEGPPVTLHVVNAPGAVSMDPPAEAKSNQQATREGQPVDPCDQVELPYCETVNLDVEVDWELVVCNNYTKTINWIGFPSPPDILFDLTDPYDGLSFNLTSKACVEVGELFEDTIADNDCTEWCPTLTITYLLK